MEPGLGFQWEIDKLSSVFNVMKAPHLLGKVFFGSNSMDRLDVALGHPSLEVTIGR